MKTTNKYIVKVTTTFVKEIELEAENLKDLNVILEDEIDCALDTDDIDTTYEILECSLNESGENNLMMEQHQKYGQQCLCTEKKEVFSDLFLLTDKTDYNKIVDNEYEKLLKKVIFLKNGEVVFNKTGDKAFEKECYNQLAYDVDMNLYDIDTKNRTASLMAIEIEF